jgi:LuxR family maltose regulon positive regulatory protein
LLTAYAAEVRPFRMIATQLLERLNAEAQSPPGYYVERLTDRELTVLRLLPTMMSNSEIAADLFFSVNTVKTHLKSIYRKLEVGRRRDAVQRARDLNLI